MKEEVRKIKIKKVSLSRKKGEDEALEDKRGEKDQKER